MTKEGSSKIVNFLTHGIGIVLLGCGHSGDIVKRMLIFIKMFYYTPGRQTNCMIMSKFVILEKEDGYVNTDYNLYLKVWGSLQGKNDSKI